MPHAAMSFSVSGGSSSTMHCVAVLCPSGGATSFPVFGTGFLGGTFSRGKIGVRVSINKGGHRLRCGLWWPINKVGSLPLQGSYGSALVIYYGVLGM